ncbi:MAG: hypothetical protein O2807_02135 [bacterium]|nr:hypothetical protein [bacterium]
MGEKRVVLPIRGPFLFHESVVRFQNSPDELINCYDGEAFRRVVHNAAGGHFLLEARSGGKSQVEMRLLAPGKINGDMVEAGERTLRHILAADLNLAPFYRMAREDARLAPIVKAFRGLKPVRYGTLFEALLTAITTQQVNLTFGGRIRARVVKRWGERLSLNGKIHYAFPSPGRIARTRVSSYRNLQFSERKAEYVIGAAQEVASGALDEAALAALSSEAAIERLVQLRGIGRWTAEQALLRALGRVDVLPAGDLGVQKVVGRYCYGEDKVSEAKVRIWEKKWAPWGSLAMTYLFAAWRKGIAPSR